MKRRGNLKHIWCSYESLLKAFGEVKKGKTYHYNFLNYENNLVGNLNALLEAIDNGSYEPKPTRDFYIFEPKERLIQAPCLEDRIVQHAVLNAVGGLIESRFINNSFACRIGKGTHKASDELMKYLMQYKNKGYFLKIDIKKFFYSIDHNILDNQLDKIIKCKSTLDLLRKFYDNSEKVGLPLGNVTSQVLANLNLNEVDHFIKRTLKVKHYLRYMDDLIILSESKEDLRNYLALIKNKIEELNLKTNNKTKISKLTEGVDFVGYRTWYNNRVIRKRCLHGIRKKLKAEASLNRISSFLSHAKRTKSLLKVISIINEFALEKKTFLSKWVHNNIKQGDLRCQSLSIINQIK